MTSKKKKKKYKYKYKRIIALLLLILFIITMVVYIAHLKIKNIYITGNNILTDKEIIKLAQLEDYPAYINTYLIDIKANLLKNDYIKDVKIKRKLIGKIYIDIDEYKPLCIYNNKLIISSKKEVDNIYNIDYVPYITNNIDKIYDKFTQKLSLINDDILVKISHIEYTPNEVDKERFLLYMVDNNYVYVTLSKIEKINKYNLVLRELDNKKGIIYLDSGDYVEIKD